MKRTILAIAALGILSSAAFGSDLARPRTYTSAAPAPPSWTGFYAGINAGYGWGSDGQSIDGALAGGQIGYNWQLGQFVFGIEGDGDWSGQTGTVSFLNGLSVRRSLPWLATARARVGYVYGPVLLYGTGGAAWTEYRVRLSAPNGSSLDSGAQATAWTVGAGLEWMFAPKWSAKIEYLHVDTGNQNVTLFGQTVSGAFTDDIVRVGANYHF